MENNVLEASMMKLYSAYEALEREVYNLMNVGKEDDELSFDTIQLRENSNISNTQTTSRQNGPFLGNMKTDAENMIKQKIEVDVLQIAISKAIKLDQIETIKKVEVVESKATELKRQNEKLKVICDQILDKEQVWRLRNSVCRLTSVFSIQLLLFVLVLYIFVLRFLTGNMKDVDVCT